MGGIYRECEVRRLGSGAGGASWSFVCRPVEFRIRWACGDVTGFDWQVETRQRKSNTI